MSAPRELTIVGLSGSLRRASFNTALLRAMAERMPEGVRLEVRTIAGIPVYDGDLESEGEPASVAALKEAVARADGLILATPEYNYSLPGPLKNAIDWMSRPAAEIARVFGDKPVVVVGASGGPGGTRLAQAAWLPVLGRLGARVVFGRGLYVANAAKVFDAQGALHDEPTLRAVDALLAHFFTACRRS